MRTSPRNGGRYRTTGRKSSCRGFYYDCRTIIADCFEGKWSDLFAEWSEAACAVVVHKLARFKQPRCIVFLDQPPKNSLGKVQNNELRKLL
jgi:acyl-CoA synthetase (AMP-forming)/AMP-acid ligase II